MSETKKYLKLKHNKNKVYVNMPLFKKFDFLYIKVYLVEKTYYFFD